MITRSRRLSLKLVYQVTHKMMIFRSKWRPLNTVSIVLNRCIPQHRPGAGEDAFAPPDRGSPLM